MLGTLFYIFCMIIFALMTIISFLMGTLIVFKTGKIVEWYIIGTGVGLSFFLFLYYSYERFN
ncbi:hypothetical protein YWH7054_00160 [Fusobacterium nucleatum YWH7054]|nr:hypothetical protein [Fusobacterium nucleatum]MCG6845259.1 hypothetical protein [Fusobacterium nucleatum]MCL4576491.1 hypothetical protein [Fusobacterium nucleatum YWH7056]MCL4582076.1 hypothetical protein [Fusobacterium nucleatum YWH7054]MCL4593167.1 hypothetical protein [Fusobacterium nucleatum YWH7053]